MAKIGIVCDDYKVPMFEEELSAKGIIYECKPFTKTGYTIITCMSEQHIIGPITNKVHQWWSDHLKKVKNN